MRAQQPNSPASRTARRRRGVILLAVLIALVLLTLAGYQYADLMQSEYRASDNAHRQLQARAIADSGIYYAAALLASPENINNVLGGNIANNPQHFMDVQVPTGDGSGTFGKFTLIAPPDPASQASTEYAYGIIDESAKINLNVLMQLDPSGTTLYNALMMLPNMSSNVAYSIVDWLDSDNTTSPGGAEDEYYMMLPQPYHCKNGPLESIEELLLVQGVMPQLLFGADLNRNGVIDANEAANAEGLGLGWSQFLTVYSREANSDASGNPYHYLNSPDIEDLYNNLSQVDAGLAAFVILYRQYGSSGGGGNSGGGGGGGNSGGAGSGSGKSGGGSNSGGGSSSQSSGATGSSNTNSSSNQGSNNNLGGANIDFTVQGKNQIKSMWSLINATVTVPGTNGQPGVTYSSPLGDPSQQANLLPLFFSTCTLSPSNEIPARININTCAPEVLYALQGILNPGLVNGGATTSGGSSTGGTTSSSSGSGTSSGTATYLQDLDIQTILGTRPANASGNQPDSAFQTPAWLYLQGGLSLATLQKLEPFITTRSQVYRVQSVGYIDQHGPAVRVEAIIDANGGRPRITAWRDLTQLGKGWDGPQ